MSLVPFDRSTSGTLAVSDYLSRARDWLATAVEVTGPEQIAAAKAEIATAAEATKQLGLSKEIQLDAQEMVRRAEYALGKAIRKGQEDGTIKRKGDAGPVPPTYIRNGAEIPTGRVGLPEKKSVSEFYSGGADAVAIKALSEAEPETFDAAIDEAKAEGNLSRSNVARKIKGCGRPAPLTARLDEIRDLVEKGATSAQIAKELGVTRNHVAETCARHGITITADAVRGRVRRFDHMRVLDHVTEQLEVAAMSLRDIDPAQLDKDEAVERLDSLTASISALSKATKKIKESFRDQGYYE